MKNASFPAVLAAALVLAAQPLAQAQPDSPRPYRDGPPAGEGRRPQRPPQDMPSGGPGVARGNPGQPLMERVLTEDQRDSLRQAMQSQREKMRELQEKIRDARKELLKTVLTEEANEKTLRAKAMEVAKLEAEMNVIRLKALADVQPALSEEQIERMLNMPALQEPGPQGEGPRGPNRRFNRPDTVPGEGGDRPRPRPPGE